jgi:putative DNA primase/helicase
MSSALWEAAAGRWPDILGALAGVSRDQLTDRHQPCPSCGGTDRYRWDSDDDAGSWFCSQCGGKDRRGGGGNGMDLLTRITGWSFAEAAREVERHLGISTSSRPSTAPRKVQTPSRSTKPTRPYRQPETPPAGTPPPALGEAVCQYPYGPDHKQPWFWIQRFELPRGKKRFLHRVWLDGGWHLPNVRRDGFSCEWPAPRPLYNLPDLLGNPGIPVVVVEGEKTCRAAIDLLPDLVPVAWANGSKALQTVDWSPLAGRHVTLWPDADNDGMACMAKLAPMLLAIDCTVAIVQPPFCESPGWDHVDAPKAWGWDLADAPAWGWGPDQVKAWIAEHSTPVLPPEAPAEPEPPSATSTPEPPRPAPVAHDLPFACLGFDDGSFFYQPATTGQVIRLHRASHTATNLLALAPIAWWESAFPGKNGPGWPAAASRLFAVQARAGVYSPDKIRGRGAWSDRGRSILHLGDRLIVDGEIHPVTSPPPTSFNYQRLASIDIQTDLPPLTDQEGVEILDIASRFHWEVPASGLLMAGWVALAPICGSLSWRPHAWLTAAHGSGKSAILDRFVGTLLDSLALWPEGNTTEASIRQELRADALPVVFDEAESNERADRIRIQNVLALARVASSSGRGFIGKGGADGSSQRFMIRSMFLLCSISTALKQGADHSRFAQLTLRNPNHLPKAERTAHWSALDRDLAAIITPQLGHRLLLRSVRLIPQIHESIAVFRRAAADRFDSQRQGDQYGTLLAGAWSLMSSRPATLADAFRLIDSNDWEPYREGSETPDEQSCLQVLMDHQIRVEGDRGGSHTRTIAELIGLANGSTPCTDISAATAEAHLGRIGIRAEPDAMVLANTAQGIARIMADTPWASSWHQVLSRIPGASKAGVVRFKWLGRTSRAVSVPLKQA